MNEKSRWWLLCVNKEKQLKKKKIKKNWYFNEIEFRIDNLMWAFLKSGYGKKKKKSSFLCYNK